MTDRQTGECADCSRVLPLAGRGLCKRCYGRHRYNGTLDQFKHQRQRLPSAEVLRAIYDVEAPLGATMIERCRVAAENLGMSPGSVERVYYRARAKMAEASNKRPRGI